MTSQSGSSPLARGLPVKCGASHWGSGIIPARAGFTSTPPPSSSTARDHPRSRGVYAMEKGEITAEEGSSPLARGLRTAIRVATVINRIIPARAGFTTHPGQLPLRPEDHPRSRGVYEYVDAISEPTTGSSPLARGLQFCDALINRIARIIPARAGFTPGWPSHRNSSEDHPRSRGVYGRAFRRIGRWRGSSPLARGLHQCD